MLSVILEPPSTSGEPYSSTDLLQTITFFQNLGNESSSGTYFLKNYIGSRLMLTIVPNWSLQYCNVTSWSGFFAPTPNPERWRSWFWAHHWTKISSLVICLEKCTGRFQTLLLWDHPFLKRGLTINITSVFVTVLKICQQALVSIVKPTKPRQRALQRL